MAKRPMLTVTAAVDAFSVERRTLQRMLVANQLDGAYKDRRGHWLIPVEAMHATGFAARQSWMTDATGRNPDATKSRKPLQIQDDLNTTNNATLRDNSTHEHDRESADLRQRISQLEDQLTAEKNLREAAERNATDLRTAMRMLETRPTQQEAPKPLRWWQRSSRR